ncbi:MAG: PAS domain S-box protein [Thermodesulfobacteria bacterium]|nr:PAS domain S-box protein [Thermodesulfobacteriota bacterium]
MSFTLDAQAILEAFFHTADLVCQLDAEGTIVASQAKEGAPLLKVLRGLSGCKLQEVSPSDLSRKVGSLLPEVFARTRPQKFRFSFEQAERVWHYEVTLFPVGDFCLAIFCDVSDFMAAEEELRASKNFLENIFNGLRDGISILDRELNIVKVNYWMRQRYKHVLPLEGKKCYQAYQQQDFICPWCPSVRTLATGLPAEEVVPYVTEEGQVGWIELSTFPLRNERGELIGVIEHCKDVTNRIRTENERRLLAQAVEHSAEAIIITDRRGRIIYSNPAFEQITGYRGQEVLHRTPNFLRDNNKASYQEIWRTLRAGKNWYGNIEIRHKKGHKIYIELSISPVRNEQDQITNYVAVLHDITQRIELETQLRRSQKLEAIGRLAGGIAHDFNNILTAVTGYSELLFKRTKGDPTAQRYAENILSSLKRASALTQKLLTFSCHRPQQKRIFDLGETLKELYPIIRRLIEERIEIDLLLPEGEYPLLGDPSDIEQIIINLVLNAAEAMPHGGRIVITLSREAPSFSDGGRYAKIEVKDNGLGIPKEHLDLIFDPFFTTKETGSGLGLFVVYNTVKHLRGYIKVSSEPGDGTTFEIFLPLSNGTPEKEITFQSLELGEQSWEDFTILIVEDEPQVRRFLRETLCQSGAKLLEAANGDEALRILVSYPKKIDLLLTDVVLPVLDGPSLSLKARELRPELKILFISGYPEKKMPEKLNGTAFLPKPFTASELLKAVEEVINDAGE